MSQILLIAGGLLLVIFTLMLTSVSLYAYGLAGLGAGIALCATIGALAIRITKPS